MNVEHPATVTCEQLQQHELPTAALDVTIVPGGQSALVGCMDGVYRLDLDSGESERLYEHSSYVSGIRLLDDGKQCVSGGYDGRLIWYDLDRKKTVRTMDAHSFWSWRLDVSPDRQRIGSCTGQYLAGGYKYEPAGQWESTVKVFDAKSGELIHQFAHVPPVQAIAFSPDGQRLAAANLMGDIRVWDVVSGEVVCSGNTPDFTSWGIIKSHCYIGGIFALRFTPDSRHLIAAGMGPMRDPMAGNGRQLWQRFDITSEQPDKVDETHEGESGEGLMEVLAVHPSAEWFLMGGRLRGGDWNAAFFSLATGSRLHALKTGYRMTGGEFTEDGGQLVVVGTDKQSRPKDGQYAPFGKLEVYQISAESS